MSVTDQASRDPVRAAPEPGLTPEELIARARAFVPTLIERQAETEERTRYAPDTHEAFRNAGFYRALVPRRYGGYEFDLRTFTTVVKELARGCPSTAWGLCLASHHAVQVAAWFPERVQEEVFGDGDFRCAAVAAPSGTIRRVASGWQIHGLHRYASGSPYSTHYLGQALPVAGDGDGPAGPPALFLAPRSTWTLRDDWGRTLGLRGSGSNSVLFDGGIVPADYVLPASLMIDFDVTGGTEGYRLHGNPLYAGRALSLMSLDFAALVAGMALGALEEYENIVKVKQTARPPIGLRAHSGFYQRRLGKAAARIRAAEALVLEGAEQYLEACRAGATGERPFTEEVDLGVQVLARESMWLSWSAMQETLFRTAGSGAAEDGQRMQRIWRDMSMAWGHLFNVLVEEIDEQVGQHRLGL
jgi:3-hydroxy-9,10-secoandrosta-1,3,5(10)-triene-9,17-dione monooxygenase